MRVEVPVACVCRECVSACVTEGVCVRVSAEGACLCLRKCPFPCLDASVKPVPGERLPSVFRGWVRGCLCVCVCAVYVSVSVCVCEEAAGSSSIPPGLAGELRWPKPALPGAAGAGGRAAEPGLHPPSQPAGAGWGREPRLSPAPCKVGGPLFPLPKLPPSPSGLRSWRRAALAAAGSLRPWLGVSGPRHFYLPPGRDGERDSGKGRDRSLQDPRGAVGDPRGGRMGAAALGRL